MTDKKFDEKRRHPRLAANFVISYRIKKQPDGYDLSQTRNVSRGGLLLTTNRAFEKGTHLAITVRFPFVAQRMEFVGEVIESRMVVRDLIYETRIMFIDLDEQFLRELGEFIQSRLGK